MKRLFLYLGICASLTIGVRMEVWAQELRIYSDEYRESICAWDVQSMQLVDLWLWARPGDEGLKCVELSTQLEGGAYMAFYPVFHPDFCLPVWGSFPDENLVACWNSCYTDWVWVLKSTLFIMSTDCITIEIQPFTGQSYTKALNCNYVEEEIAVYNPYTINCPYPCEFFWCMCSSPEISFIDVEDATHITMHLDCPTRLDTMISIDNYSLYEKDNPENAIPIIGITYDYSGASAIINYYYTFTLDEVLMPYTTYALRVGYIDGWVDDRDGAEFDFSYGPIATLLQDFEAVLEDGRIKLSWKLASLDDAVEFAVSRRSFDGDWIELPADAVQRVDLGFTYIDDGVEPDESYIYRVECESEGSRVLLFQTEPVATPAMPLSLEQNVPNPFNPSTEIIYYLPDAMNVRLEIYDISGRRVALLSDGLQPKGWQAVHWDGTDTGSRSVASGVYFYRLRAGKEVISKKMVLLR